MRDRDVEGTRRRDGQGERTTVRQVVHAGPGLDDPASLDADAREARLDRVAVLYARITAATREFLAAVADCDRHRDWEAAGFGSCTEWLAWRVGLRRNAAGERVRVARALEELPLTSASMARGEISFSKVRALTRVATPECEAELLDFARAGSTADLERIVRAWKTLGRDDEADRERMLHRTRRFSIVPDEDGMYVVRGRLSPEVAAVLMRAVDAAGDALYHRSRRSTTGGCHDEEVEPAQRRADALGLVAERALAAGFGRRAGAGPVDADRQADRQAAVEAEGGTAAEADRQAAAEADGGTAVEADDASAPISGSRAERYQVVLHVEPETLAEDGQPGRSELEDGTRLAAETARRLACDVAVVRVPRDAGARGRLPGSDARPLPPAQPASLSAESRGARACDPADPPLPAQRRVLRHRLVSHLDAGRRARTVPPALRRALEARDRGCRFPGCGLRFTDAHHIKHWADGGQTKIDNLVLLCRRHHRRVHEEGWTVASEPGTGARVVFFTPTGRAVAAAPTMSATTRSVEPPGSSADLPPSAPDQAPPGEPRTRAREAVERGVA